MYYQYKEENNLPKAIGYSTIVTAVLLIIGYFIVFGQPVIPEYGMGGIVVNYGTSEVGMGTDYMSIEEPSVDENANEVLPDRVVPTETPTPTPTQQVADKAVATQDMEDAPAVTKSEKAVKNPAAETTKEVKKSTPAINTNALYKGKKNNGTGAGDGEGGGVGNQGSKLGDPMASNYGEGGSGFGNTPLDLTSRVWEVKPKINDDGQFEGKMNVMIRVNRQGQITYVRAGVKGTTFPPTQRLIEEVERAFRSGKLRANPNAPESRDYIVPIYFKLR
ncbi:energy transducer TonB [Sphingobacterium thermophilum]|uniref:Energy transducer TonB n=1 Tax=Sphingobacterium thermophilum TaxID=768534 RepID=A0ABP8R1J1_9SPHI